MSIPAYPGRGSQKDVGARLQDVQEVTIPSVIDALNGETSRIDELIGDEETDFNALVLSILS